ncbi:MAG: hypothetical protein WA666_00660 [Nitrospirota bacterium]
MKKILIVLALVASAGCARSGYNGNFGLMNFDINNPTHLVASKPGQVPAKANTVQNYKPQAQPPNKPQVAAQVKPQPKADGKFKSHVKPQVKPRVTQVKMTPVTTQAAPLYEAKARDYDPRPKDFMYHTKTDFMNVYWNLSIKDNQAIADGYVQPSSQRLCLHAVQLELVGLDSGGNLKNSAAAVTKQAYIAYPGDKSHFRAIMVLRGGEKDFRITGSYHHCGASDFGNDSLDNIPY